MLSLWEDYYTAGSPSRTPPQCAIWVDGYTVLPEDFPLLSIHQCEALHVVLTDNRSAPLDAPSRFVTQLGGQVHVRQNAEPWYSTECLNHMGRYLVWRKMSISNSITVLQHTLVQAEQEAAALVQQHARTNPPPFLMAVVGSSAHIAGWSFGIKDIKPVGGAPCPATFKLPVHRRRGQESDENTPRDTQW